MNMSNHHNDERPPPEGGEPPPAGRFLEPMSMNKSGHEHERNRSCIMNGLNHVS